MDQTPRVPDAAPAAAPGAALDTLGTETRTFAPPAGFTARANAADPGIYERAEADFEGFWAEQARTLLWRKPFTRVLEWEVPYAKWFADGQLNASENCLDRHVSAGKGGKVAFHWEGEPGDTRTITYQDLLDDTSRCANGLKELGVKKGDRVAIYMPMIPELPAAMLACARIGAPFTVVFGGFSAEALSGRINDSQAKLLITADGGFRKGSIVPLKKNADEAVAMTTTIEKVLVVQRTKQQVGWTEGRDVWWHDVVARQPATCEAEALDAEHMLYLLYTSGTTAKPKGIVHTTAGYLTGVAATHKMVFDIKDEDVYWCAADIGWVTGHSYIVFGPLANGATSVMYEGTPDFPDKDRWWAIIEKYKVSVLYCAPTAIRTFMKWGAEYVQKHDMGSLRLLGSVGEPINPEAWLWYQEHIGGGRCPIVDTWWMTETGSILITPLPGITTTKPGSATFPFPGIKADVVDEEGKSVPLGQAGYLVLSRPWPSMLRGIYNADKRYRETYWSKYPGSYFAGDGAKRDTEGYYWLMGRVDDVMKISGHRISTTEVESALVSHPRVAEAAVIGRDDPVTTQAIFAFVTLRGGVDGTDELSRELREHVVAKIGSIARPKTIMFTPELPKTRSGKIMRRLLRDIANGVSLGDTTTLADATVVDTIRTASASGKDD
ncbi:MAG TPA: acetate--CoA ligase [Candidatus Saccharimonadales bacterium]|nr:acetate--CoA ligase [Candidatus Saccharimonadales bacterium]